MSQPPKIELSVIIVNYNVKEFLANCLQSVQKASKSISTEIFVVDNNSSDSSISFLKPRFRDVTFIENDENLGFGKANNQAIKKASGKYTLILNPDTLLQEDTLQILIEHMDQNENCGACGCKILNPDGTFAPESRRSIPTVSAAIYKAIGLATLFPENKHFSAYYQGWKDENEGGQVPVLSGSFMFFRTSCLKEVGGFDERFFMYGEDIDLCYRVTEAGWEIHYVPKTSIIHYKGESTKKNELTYNRVFNDAIYKFFDKHYTSRYSRLFKFLIFWAIQFRAIASFFINNIRSYKYVLIDLLVLNGALLMGMFIRAYFDPGGIFSMIHLEFLWLNLLWSFLYLFFAQSFGVIKEHALSIVGSLKAVFFSFLMLVAITFFIRNLAFSRIILAVSLILGFTFVGLIRFMRVNRIKSTKFSRGKVSPLRMLIVGAGDNTQEMIQKINGKAKWQVEIAGVVLQNGNDLHGLDNLSGYVVGSIDKLPSLTKTTRADIVVFLMDTVTHKELLSSIQSLSDQDLEFKVVPNNMNFILGKADVEYLVNLPLVDLNLNFFNPIQKAVKRSLDIGISFLCLLFLLPFSWVWLFNKNNKQKKVSVFDGRSFYELDLMNENGFIEKVRNRFKICAEIFIGRLSIVGSLSNHTSETDNYRYKTGLTGYVHINKDRISDHKDREQFDLFYLQNYSVWLDLDIIFKALIREKSLIKPFIRSAVNSSVS